MYEEANKASQFSVIYHIHIFIKLDIAVHYYNNEEVHNVLTEPIETRRLSIQVMKNVICLTMTNAAFPAFCFEFDW